MLGLAFVVVAVALFAVPFLLLAGLLFTEFRKNPRETSLTSEEAAELSKIDAELSVVRTNLSQIKKEGSNLRIKSDGTYDGRSNIGYMLNRTLAHEQGLKLQAAEVRGAPLRRLNNWIHITSLRFAFRSTTPAYIVIFLILYARLYTPVSDAPVGIYGSALIAGFGSGLLFVLAYFGRRVGLRNATAAEEEQRRRKDDSEREIQFRQQEERRRQREAEAAAEEQRRRRKEEQDRRRNANGASGGMNIDLALKILELEAMATEQDIRAAHRRLIKRVHPDTGGSAYFTQQLNAARDVALAHVRRGRC